MSFQIEIVKVLSEISHIRNNIYPIKAVENVKSPYVIYVPTPGEKVKTLTGYYNSSRLPIEVNILASSFKELNTITSLVTEKISNIEGNVLGDYFVQSVTYNTSPVLYENQVKLYRSVIDFEFYVMEGVI